ncbi:integrase catalytic domain-containing protein [Nephila pilipes]|uniref:Integrase catalytic domain-containing protein n=1 Tax=Nephila pilipes TaxID=299642 RepID=A0A8X6Q1S2_NEPPI|nr:integrase catalytic domain-containing protein [Nephila pilipes]
MELNDLYIECNRKLQALNALGENTEAYGRILAPKIIRAFPTEICCRWIIYVKREKLAEENITTRLMQFLAEEVEGSVEAQKIRDGGSQASFVDVKLIDKLKLNVINSSSLRVQAFESSFTQEQRRCVQLTLSGLWSKQSILISAFESNNSYTTHPAVTLEISQFAHKNKLKLADPPDNSSLPIELLIGGDYYWQIVTVESPIKLSESFVMVPSMLGWIPSGSRTHTTITDNTFVHQFSVQVSNDCLNDQVRCLWELDSIGIQDIQKRRMSARDEEILICSIKISRYIGISSHTPYSVHVFCDASERAYGSVLYIVYIVTSQSNVHIDCSRNRLAPIKRVTLPRLELLAALMGTLLLKYFCKEVDIQPSAATLWTDSKITLSWIRSNPNKWKTFVCNRTTEILQYTSPAQWRYCPGTQNPADHLSREDLSSYEQLKTDNEVRKPLTQSLYVETTNPVIDITHYSSYTKLLRVTAWILRFLHNCRNEQRFLFELTAEELQKAKDY